MGTCTTVPTYVGHTNICSGLDTFKCAPKCVLYIFCLSFEYLTKNLADSYLTWLEMFFEILDAFYVWTHMCHFFCICTYFGIFIVLQICLAFYEIDVSLPVFVLYQCPMFLFLFPTFLASFNVWRHGNFSSYLRRRRGQLLRYAGIR